MSSKNQTNSHTGSTFLTWVYFMTIISATTLSLSWHRLVFLTVHEECAHHELERLRNKGGDIHTLPYCHFQLGEARQLQNQVKEVRFHTCRLFAWISALRSPPSMPQRIGEDWAETAHSLVRERPSSQLNVTVAESPPSTVTPPHKRAPVGVAVSAPCF